jgi:peroxiredoxin
MRRLFGFLLLLLPLLSYSNSVKISGNASFFKNEVIQFTNSQNLLSQQKHLITETIIHEDGNYQINLSIETPQIIWVKIEMRELELHVHPNSDITLNFYPIENASNQRVPLRFSINYTKLDSNLATELVYHNIQSDFAQVQNDIQLNTELIELYKNFFSSTDFSHAKYLKNDPLFADFYTYFKAKALLPTSISKNEIITQNLIESPIKYDNPEYLKFVKSSLSPRVHNLLIKFTEEFDEVSKEYKIYPALLSFLEKDSLLGNKELRSLALFTYLKSASSNKFFSKQLKAGVIGQMANFSEFVEQQEAARNLQSTQRRLEKGTEAPIFELSNSAEKFISIEKSRGKLVYLGFIHTKSLTCQRDLQVIQTLRKKHRQASFLMVICDRDSVPINQLPKESSNFKYLYLNKDYTVLTQYQIWSYPVYYLIDKHGYFIESPASSPIEMFEPLAIIFAPKSGRKKYEIVKP